MLGDLNICAEGLFIELHPSKSDISTLLKAYVTWPLNVLAENTGDS